MKGQHECIKGGSRDTPTLTLVKTGGVSSIIHTIESRTLFFSSCKKFCNSGNRYKSVTVTVFVIGWKKRVAAFEYRSAAYLYNACCHFYPKCRVICDRNGLFSDNDAYHSRPLYP